MLINFYIVCFSNDDNINNNKVKVAQLCPTLCGSMDYTVHEILQGRILEWVAFPFPRGSSQSRDWTQVSLILGRFFTNWAVWKAIGDRKKSVICTLRLRTLPPTSHTHREHILFTFDILGFLFLYFHIKFLGLLLSLIIIHRYFLMSLDVLCRYHLK